MNGKLKDVIPAMVAFFVCAGFLSAVALLIFHQVPTGNQDALEIIVGGLGTAFASVVFYYFGSSSGSAEKTSLMAQVSKSTAEKVLTPSEIKVDGGASVKLEPTKEDK